MSVEYALGNYDASAVIYKCMKQFTTEELLEIIEKQLETAEKYLAEAMKEELDGTASSNS